MLHIIDATKAPPARCHYQVLTAALKGLKRKIDSILGDGNCLYRALAKELFGEEGGHAAIRHYISPFSAINKDTLVPFSTADWHLSKAAKEGFWGGTAETVAMESAFQVPIWTYCQQPGHKAYSWILFQPLATKRLEALP